MNTYDCQAVFKTRDGLVARDWIKLNLGEKPAPIIRRPIRDMQNPKFAEAQSLTPIHTECRKYELKGRTFDGTYFTQVFYEEVAG